MRSKINVRQRQQKKNQVAVDLYASIESCNRFNTDAREKIRLFNEEHLQFIYWTENSWFLFVTDSRITYFFATDLRIEIEFL